MSAKARVVVVGGGFGGLETSFYLRHKLKDKVDITLVSELDHFVYKPNIIYIPFGESPEKFKIPLSKPSRRKDISLFRSRVTDIDPDKRIVKADGKNLCYDYLVVATGAAMRTDEIPGLAEHGVTVWTIEEMIRLKRELEALMEGARRGARRRLLFLIPPNNRCSGPLYEIVMMVDTWLRRHEVRESVEVAWTTFEEGYIQAFGPRLNTVVSNEFEERGILGFKGWVVTEVQPGVVRYQNGEKREFDLLISFPPYVAKERFGSFAVDDRGFINVDPDSRRVKGQQAVFAAGDAADFPIKQAFLTLLQADTIGEHISAEISGREPSFKFEPMSMCVMEELNKATFAQVPLVYTDDPKKPIAVDLGSPDEYRVGVSPIWRLGKAVLGLYLPWRFSSGEPFHAGFAWEAMDLGLKVMSRVLSK